MLKRDIAELRAGNTMMADLRGGGIVVEAGKRSVVFAVGRIADFYPKKR